MPEYKGKMFTYAYHIDRVETESTSIRIYGLDEKKRSVCLRVREFTPFVVVELPKLTGGLQWDSRIVAILKSRINKDLRKCKPMKSSLIWRKKLYCAQQQHHLL